MTTLNAILSLNPCGPQNNAATQAPWKFCLRLSAGYKTEPAPAERLGFALALLPWRLFKGNGLWGLVVDATGAMPSGFNPFDLDVDPPDRFPDTPGASGGPPTTGFTNLLRDDIRANLNKLLQDNASSASITLAWDAGGGAATGTKHQPTKVSNKDGAQLSLPGTLKTLSTLPPDMSQALRAAWYFKVDYSKLAPYIGAASKWFFIVAPKQLCDTRVAAGIVCRMKPIAATPAENTSIYQFSYAASDGTVAAATGLALSLSQMGSGDDYWLEVVDVRGTTISDIEQKIDQSANSLNRVAAVSAGDLAAALVVKGKPGGLIIPSNLLIAKYLLDHTPPKWKDEQPADRGQVVLGILDTLAQRPSTSPMSPSQWIKNQARLSAQAWWLFDTSNGTSHWATTALNAQKPGDIPNFENLQQITVTAVGADKLAQELIDLVFQNAASPNNPRPALPNDGIDLLIDDANTSLLHEDSDPQNTGVESQKAAAGLLVRRATDLASLANKPWRLVTSGLPVLDTNNDLTSQPFGIGGAVPPHVDEVFPGGVGMDFVNGVRRSELTYRGINARVSPPLTFVHRQTVGRHTPDNPPMPFARLSSLNYQLPGSLGTGILHATESLTPPLRDGDFYEFKSFTIDRTFGLPDALTVSLPSATAADNYNPGFDWNKLATGLPAGIPTAVVQFLRRIPVGDVNLVPPDKGWPTLPDGVILRAVDWLHAKLPAQNIAPSKRIHANSAPALLLGKNDNFFNTQNLISTQYDFTIEPPRIDEFTLSRWCMPPPGTQTGVIDLKTELKRIFRERDKLLASDISNDIAAGKKIAADLLPHDMAVTAFGIRCTYVDDTGREFDPRGSAAVVSVTPNPNRTFMRMPVPFQVKYVPPLAAGSPPPPLTAAPGQIAVFVPEGWFCAIEVLPLVSATDFTRFEKKALLDLLDSWDWQDAGGAHYSGFESSWILCESATKTMPDQKAIYDGFSISIDPAANVRATLTQPRISGMAFVDGVVLSRQRWVWRNRPMLDPKLDPVTVSPDEWRRLSAGGMPKDLFSANCDQAHAVLGFDVLAGLDGGWADRGNLESHLPRLPGGAALTSALLAVDNREGIASGDYLRYGLALRSRYASLFNNGSGVVQATGNFSSGFERAQVWRRIGVPYRGDTSQIKPLKIFTILPLTRSPRDQRFGKNAVDRPTPFLVVLDEVWFREYGQGEVLEAYLALESNEIGHGRSSDFFAAPDIVGLRSLARRLVNATSGVEGFLWNHKMLPVDQRAIATYDAAPNQYVAASNALRQIVDFLNRVIQGDPIQDQANFTNVRWADDTKYAIQHPPTAPDGIRKLYRMLIEDSFPGELFSVWRPYRAAPLPDHHVVPANDKRDPYPYYGGTLDVEETDFPAHPLTAFGPFGYTLDQSDNQALANATAYVIYPPDGVGPNWWMGVRLRRRLDMFDQSGALAQARSKPSDVKHMYTRPADLTSPDSNGQGEARLVLRADQTVELVSLQLNLEVLLDSAIAGQYACVLMLGNLAADGGIGAQIFLPTGACWIVPSATPGSSNKFAWKTFTTAAVPRGSSGFGRIALILLNGRYPAGNHPLAGATDLPSLWNQLLPVADDKARTDLDSPGTIAGISDTIRVDVE